MTKVNSRNNVSGFTLLLASIIASVLLSLGLSMFVIAQKEIILSSLGRDSQYAFYAADAGAECALYWDFKGGFDTVTPTVGAKCNGMPIGEPIGCNETTCKLGGNGYVNGVSVNTFEFSQNNKCINVEVLKYDTGRTEINSKGYSTACNSTSTTRQLERAVKMRY
jgi:hypothetical protein